MKTRLLQAGLLASIILTTTPAWAGWEEACLLYTSDAADE